MRLAEFACFFHGVMAGILLLVPPPATTSADFPHVDSPVSPAESLQHIVVSPGLKVELAAHEPQVVDPIEIRFDEDGRMWVVEMRDYPTGAHDGKHGHSRISVLEDRDSDGFFETATVFADNLQFATGVQPWKGGAFVTMSGVLAYMKDTNHDGKADFTETWYTGFAEQNTQLRANHPRLALDNHIYIANGLRGGTIADARRADGKQMSISGMDFRFDPITLAFEAVSGVGQFGLTFDDYGNRFVCTNRNPALHIVLENHHLAKNPAVTVSAVSHDVARAGEQSRVFPITRSWTTSNLHAGQFTAACGLEIYRGDALPDEFYGNIFVCEPTGHLVHREIMEPNGVTFRSTPASSDAEFFASRDEWCSPVNLEVGPDGALYVVDMYRAVIEHPEFMPSELRERADLTGGHDRGRIYRIVPAKRWRRPASPHLSSTSSAALIDLLSHSNAWWRGTASRLLLERQDKSIAAELRQAALHHDSPIARFHALRLMQGLSFLADDLLIGVLNDPHPRVIEQAVIASESFVNSSEAVQTRIAKLVQHEDARVRFQALLVARPLTLAPARPTDEWESKARLIAAADRGGTVLAEMLMNQDALDANVRDPKEFITQLARLAAASSDEGEQETAIKALVANDRNRLAGLAGFLSEASRRGMSIDTIRFRLDEPSRRQLDASFHEARRVAADQNQSNAARFDAIDLLAAAGDASGRLAAIALGEHRQAVRLRAISALATTAEHEPWHLLMKRFSNETPALQREIVSALLMRPDRTLLLLDELAEARVQSSQLDINQTNLLLQHPHADIKSRAVQILASAVPEDRQRVLAEYRSALTMTADAVHGRAVFEKQCASCHRIDDLGVNFAPDISDSREKSREQLLTDILQPNRAVDSNFFSYTAIATDGIVHTGVLAAENSTSITLKQEEGKAVVLRRDEIDELYSNGVSLMPDGVERQISKQDMADLISFIKNWRYLDDPSIHAARQTK